MLRDGSTVYGLATDATVLIGTFVVLNLIAARLYPRMVT
jgi:hypothetical protein